MKYDVIIIGAGPGGIFSAYELMKKSPELKVAVFEAGYSLEKRRCPIDGKKVKSCIKCPTCAIMSGFGGAGAGFGAGAEYGTGGCNGGCGGRSARTNTGEMNMNVNIDMYTALLGGEGIITLSNGSKIKLKIKPETQNGTKVRVRGKGYDRGDGTFGDLMITYNVKLPTGLNEKQKELLRQMKEAK